MYSIVQILLIAVFVVLLVASLLWVAADAQPRERSVLLVTLLCVLTWPIGPVVWMIVRPPPRLDA